MNVSYIASSAIPSQSANSIQVMNMCQAFQQEGHQVTLFAPSTFFVTHDLSSIWNFYGIRHRFLMHWVPMWRPLQGHDFGLLAALSARRTHCDFVFTRVLSTAFWTSLMGLPTVWEAHGPPPGRYGPFYFRGLISGKGYSGLVVISHALKKIFLNHYPEWLGQTPLLVQPDGVDLGHFEPNLSVEVAKRIVGFEQCQFHVGYAGHLYEGRGIDLILELAQQLPEISFAIVGGADQDVCRQREQVQQAGLRNVCIVGHVPNAKVSHYLQACDVLLMPYQRSVAVQGGGNTVEWMSPMKMFEYMAAGRLIISSDLPVLKEVLNASNAVLCSPDNTSAWIASLRRAMTDTNWRERLAAQARIDVRQYTWRRRVRGIMEGIDFR